MRNKRRGKRWVQVLAALIALGVLVEAALLIAVCACSVRGYEATPADCAIVLGARVWPDGEVSNSLAYRLDAALEAYEAGRVRAIVVTGARGGDEPVAEAVASRDYLRERGVPEADICVEDGSYDTIQNLENAKKIMEDRGFATALIATSDYHVTRAMWIADEVGLDARPLPAESPRKLVTWWTNRIRETVSWVLFGVNRIVG